MIKTTKTITVLALMVGVGQSLHGGFKSNLVKYSPSTKNGPAIGIAKNTVCNALAVARFTKSAQFCSNKEKMVRTLEGEISQMGFHGILLLSRVPFQPSEENWTDPLTLALMLANTAHKVKNKHDTFRDRQTFIIPPKKELHDRLKLHPLITLKVPVEAPHGHYFIDTPAPGWLNEKGFVKGASERVSYNEQTVGRMSWSISNQIALMLLHDFVDKHDDLSLTTWWFISDNLRSAIKDVTA